VIVTAQQVGNENYLPAPNVTQSITVFKSDQIILVTPVPTQIAGSSSIQLSSTASSKLPVTYTVISGPGKVNNDMLSFSNAGNILIQVNQAGDNNYNGTSTTFTILVVSKPQYIRFPLLSDQRLGEDPLILAATASSGLSVKYHVVEGPAVVDGNSVRFTGVGLVHLAADQAGDSIFAEAPRVLQSIRVFPGLKVNINKLYSITNPSGGSLSIFLDTGMKVDIQESADLGVWTTVGSIQGQGVDKAVRFTLRQDSSSSRFWRLR
jgi:hypothetical protein